MATLHVAHTAPVNPAGATPTLTTQDVWAGLARKIRFPQEFVPVIEGCDVVEEKAGLVVRDVRFKEGMGPKREAREWVRSFGEAWHDFEQEDGSHIRNIISAGPSGEPSDFYLTYTFEYKMAHLQEGSAEAKEQEQKFKEGAKIAVEKSLVAIRKMVEEGKIKA